jgi:hypothetical protein
MRANAGPSGVVIATAMTKQADVDNDKVDRDKGIADEQKVENDLDRVNDRDVDNENDENDEDANDTDEANEQDKDMDNDKDKDKGDKAKPDTDNDDHGQAVSAVASLAHKGDKHPHRGR